MPAQSKQQQKFMGMVHALKKGDMKPSDASPELKKAAQSMSDKDAKDFASTSHKGLPKKVKQEILNKLKEYANSMGRDHLGGDDYTSSKKGGLRDFDGYDNVDYNPEMEKEGKLPNNWMQGRVSDYHTSLRGKKKDYSGGTNFRTDNSGQEDLEEGDLEDTIHQVKKFDKPKDGKLLTIKVINKLKDKRNKSKSISNKEKLQKMIDTIEGEYKKGKYIKEYGQRLDLSYLEDEEARLDGTPKPKDAIDKDLEEQTLNELGVFPIRAFLQDMIPGNLLKTTTPQDKERLKSTIKDLIITLNKFWKQNNIPYRVREK